MEGENPIAGTALRWKECLRVEVLKVPHLDTHWKGSLSSKEEGAACVASPLAWLGVYLLFS